MNREKFEHIVNIAVSTNPFYKEWIKDTANVPILDRKTFLENNQLILNGYRVTSRTSGSTGIPVSVSQSQERINLETRYIKMFSKWHNKSRKSILIIHDDYSRYPGRMIDINQPLQEQIQYIEKLKKIGFNSITTFPTNGEQICKAYIENKLDTSSITQFSLYGESLDDYQFNLIKQAFPSAKISITYSSEEFGLIAGLCPYDSSYYHIFDDKLGIEILRDDGTECNDGEMGRVIITDYYNEQSPLIRYEIGDYAVKGNCPCGKIHYPSFSAVYGKTRGALVDRLGNRRIFIDLSIMLRDIPGMKQYQVIQNSIENFEVLVVNDRVVDDEVKDVFQKYFGYLPNIEIKYVDSIPKGPNGKFYSSICRI